MTLLFAASLHAADFGPLRVIPEPSIANAVRPNAYVERIFTVTNDSTEPHNVELRITQAAAWNPVSRTIAVGPRASQRVSMAWLASGRPTLALRVAVDGKEYGSEVPLEGEGYDYYQRAVLLGRSLDETQWTKVFSTATSSYSEIAFRRASVAPSDWSTRWLAYARFSGIVLSRKDWSELSTASRAAIERWVRLGGMLMFVPGAGEPASATPQIVQRYVGFGTIEEANFNVGDITTSLRDRIRSEWFGVPGSSRVMEATRSDSTPLLGSRRVPTALIFWSIMLFALVAGPISLWLMARRNQRVWIFVTVPAAGFVVAVAIVVVTLIAEGIHSISRVRGLTLLDETAGEATTFGVAGFYCTFPPGGKIRFDGESEVLPSGIWHNRKTDLTDGQRFIDLIDSRVSSYFSIRRSEPRRERVVFQATLNGVTAVNGLGAPIDDLQVMLPNGTTYRGKKIAPGAQQQLAAIAPPAHVAQAAALNMLAWENNFGDEMANRIAGAKENFLRPGTYIATLATSPFVERPLPGSESSTNGVVFGLMKSEAPDAR